MITTTVEAPRQQRYALQRALLVYDTREQYSRAPAFVTIHDVQHDQHQASLQPGRLMSERELLELLARLTGNGSLAYLPPHVLASSSAGIAWHSPASERPLFFKTDGPHADPYLDQHVSGRAYPVPALLWVAKSHALSIYALATNERPTPSTPLYRAPFFNTFDTGGVCTGSMPRPTGVTPATTSEYERAFFGSYFSHPNAAALINPNAWAGSYGEAWTRARELGHYPNEWLTPLNKTLAEVLP